MIFSIIHDHTILLLCVLLCICVTVWRIITHHSCVSVSQTGEDEAVMQSYRALMVMSLLDWSLEL